MVAMSAANSLNRVQLIRDKVILGVSDSLYLTVPGPRRFCWLESFFARQIIIDE